MQIFIFIFFTSIFIAGLIFLIIKISSVVSEKRYVALLEECQEMKEDVEKALDDVSSKYNFNHYINNIINVAM